MIPSDDAVPTQVAPHLTPVRSFDRACRLVIDYLCEVAPMGLWAVTRVTDGNQLVLASSGGAYPVHPGDAFRFSDSLCSRMVSGEGPRIAPDAARELEQARREADADVLTGLLNRRGWDRYLQVEEERFRRFGDPACVVVIDLDRLKVVNDTQGHEAGDRYIQRAAQVLASTVRQGDVLARLGGDEFGIVAVGATSEQASEMVLRADRAMRLSGVTGSFGFAPYSVVTGFPGAWEAADQAMYEQKRRRRARVDV
jgi:diguanylate cyclase (GGDEF)-like protein